VGVLFTLKPRWLPHCWYFLTSMLSLWVPNNDARNDQMVILTITWVRKRTKVPL
jgi:hypothetical protein